MPTAIGNHRPPIHNRRTGSVSYSPHFAFCLYFPRFLSHTFPFIYLGCLLTILHCKETSYTIWFALTRILFSGSFTFIRLQTLNGDCSRRSFQTIKKRPTSYLTQSFIFTNPLIRVCWGRSESIDRTSSWSENNLQSLLLPWSFHITIMIILSEKCYSSFLILRCWNVIVNHLLIRMRELFYF